MSKSNFNVYTNLDTLFDTRLGLIRHYLPDKVDSVFEHRLYWDRRYTNWTRCTKGAITEQMVTGLTTNDEVLRESRITGILEYILHLTLLHRENIGRNLVDKPLCLVIDTHGYTFDDTEKEALREMLCTVIQTPTFKVTFVDQGLKHLTPEFVDESYGALVIYNAMDWLALHRDDIINYTNQHRSGFGNVSASLTDIYLIAPMLQNEDCPGVTKEEERKGYAVFKAVMRAFISLEFIHVSYFSEFIDIDDIKEKPSTQENKWAP